MSNWLCTAYGANLSAVEVVEHSINYALELKASDIHYEPGEQEMRIRYRIDGLLYPVSFVNAALSTQVVARIKVLASLDIAEKRVPQDGKFIVSNSNSFIDFRVATFPTPYGEKIVIRILDRSHNLLTLNKLGLSSLVLTRINKLILSSQGFILVVGPTGSGKTTTLYALLNELITLNKNIITLEDPIEYTIADITQGQILPEIGFTFQKGIKSLLRHDPDVIMVGEIRDKETAVTALQAALTGHLVLSTVHTQDAPSAVIRLIEMGIASFLLSASLAGILAQRLVRLLCSFCKQPATLLPEDIACINYYNLTITQHYKAVGCTECKGLGYKGRIGVFELLFFNSKIKAVISQRFSYNSLREQAIKDGMQLLIEDAAEKVNAGLISIHELKALALY